MLFPATQASAYQIPWGRPSVRYVSTLQSGKREVQLSLLFLLTKELHVRLLNFFFHFLFQTSDILYYEILDIPLPELQGLKTLKVAFHHATKEEVCVDCYL